LCNLIHDQLVDAKRLVRLYENNDEAQTNDIWEKVDDRQTKIIDLATKVYKKDDPQISSTSVNHDEEPLQIIEETTAENYTLQSI
jgi:hypothetical protein